MRERITSITNFYYATRASFVQRSPLYKLLLDKRHNIFNPEKFITDPWSGNANIGKSILDGKFSIEGFESSIDIIKTISHNRSVDQIETEYIGCFNWIRDLQAIGGNNSRKYARKAISEFIASYGATKGFWLHNPAWKPAVIGERIVNWILSYSFYASGSSDKFQKEVLSSINEQFSHLLKTHKAETNPYSRLITLKAIFFCLCSLKKFQARQIRKTITEICNVVANNLDDSGMLKTRNPIDQFNMFRSLLEIRFMAKSSNISVPESIFYDSLSRMASCIRFLRLGDGEISRHSGEEESAFHIVPSQHMIDTALSLVDIWHYSEKTNTVRGFDRLSTKRTTAIVNTEVCDVKSKFNSSIEPGINIFDFEASFGITRLINRSDISILFDGFFVKAGQTSHCFFSKEVVANELCFDGEIHLRDKLFNFAMRRNLFISISKPSIRGIDFVYITGNHDALFRFVLNKNSKIEQINPRKILITLNKKDFLLTVNESSPSFEIIIKTSYYPTIEILASGNSSKETMLDWKIEEAE